MPRWGTKTVAAPTTPPEGVGDDKPGWETELVGTPYLPISGPVSSTTLKPVTDEAIQKSEALQCLKPRQDLPPISKGQVLGALREGQSSLAIKATTVANLALDQMQHLLEKGQDLGSGVVVPLSPAALTSIYKEARETIAAPIKTAQDDRSPAAPVSINTNNPDVIKVVIAELRRYHEERKVLEATICDSSDENEESIESGAA